MIITSNTPITPEMKEAIQKQRIYWYDQKCYHYFFDFKFKDKWISCKHINNELTSINVTVYED